MGAPSEVVVVVTVVVVTTVSALADVLTDGSDALTEGNGPIGVPGVICAVIDCVVPVVEVGPTTPLRPVVSAGPPPS